MESEPMKGYPLHQPETRFIPYVSMCEIGALYFSDSVVLAEKLGVKLSKIEAILTACGEPERINDSNQTAPSKRLGRHCEKFKKTATGIAIANAFAKEIGIAKMRQACPIFDAWLTTLEQLKQNY